MGAVKALLEDVAEALERELNAYHPIATARLGGGTFLGALLVQFAAAGVHGWTWDSVRSLAVGGVCALVRHWNPVLPWRRVHDTVMGGGAPDPEAHGAGRAAGS